MDDRSLAPLHLADDLPVERVARKCAGHSQNAGIGGLRRSRGDGQWTVRPVQRDLRQIVILQQEFPDEVVVGNEHARRPGAGDPLSYDADRVGFRIGAGDEGVSDNRHGRAAIGFPDLSEFRLGVVEYVVDDLDAGERREVDVGIAIAIMGAQIAQEAEMLRPFRIGSEQGAFVVLGNAPGKQRIAYGNEVVVTKSVHQFITRP